MTKFPGSGCCWSLEAAPAVGLISIAGIDLLVLSTFTPRSAVRACRQRCCWSWSPRSRASGDRRAAGAIGVNGWVPAGSAAYLGRPQASGIGRELGLRGSIHQSNRDHRLVGGVWRWPGRRERQPAPPVAPAQLRMREECQHQMPGQNLDLVSEGGHQHGNVADVPRARRHIEDGSRPAALG
jgi:hypothetical protein